MKSRLLTAVLLSGLVAVAGPAWGQSRGGGHVGGGRSFGGHSGGVRSFGAHVGGFGHPGVVGHGVPGGPGGDGGHGRGIFRGDGGGRHGGGHPWRGYRGWGGYSGWRGYDPWVFGLSFPFWWGGAYGWGSPYDWSGWPYGYGSYGGYYPYGGDYGYYGTDPEVGPRYSVQGAIGSGSQTTPAAAFTWVELQVSPASAVTVLNGVAIGSVDQFAGADGLYLAAGRYTLEFRATGFRSKKLNLAIGGQVKTVVSLGLQREAGDVAAVPAPPLPAPPYGYRFTPDFGPAAQEHAVAPSPAGREPLQRGDVAATSPPAPAAAPAAAPELGALKLHVVPRNAAVYLDGALLGTGDELDRLQRGVAVTPGAHRIDVVAPGLAGKTLQVEAAAGKAQELSITLE